MVDNGNILKANSQYVYHFGYTKDTNKPQIKSLVQGAAEALRGP